MQYWPASSTRVSAFLSDHLHLDKFSNTIMMQNDDQGGETIIGWVPGLMPLLQRRALVVALDKVRLVRHTLAMA